jgi:hypothetical protein
MESSREDKRPRMMLRHRIAGYRVRRRRVRIHLRSDRFADIVSLGHPWSGVLALTIPVAVYVRVDRAGQEDVPAGPTQT